MPKKVEGTQPKQEPEEILPPWMREKIQQEEIERDNANREQPIADTGGPISFEIPTYDTGEGEHKREIGYGNDKAGQEFDIPKN